MYSSNQKLFKMIGLLAMIVMVGSGLVFAFSFPGFGKPEKVAAVNGVVDIPVAQVADGKAHFYRFADGGTEIVFFVVKGSGGAMHAAFDACDVCFREKQGYFQDGDFMVCRNCSQKFATNRIGRTAGGGCNPSPLAFAQDGGRLSIRADDLKPGARFF